MITDKHPDFFQNPERNSEGASAEMPRYQSHKKVWALQIESVEAIGESATTDESPIVRLTFVNKGFAPRDFSLRGKPTPEAGWYMVQYDSAYISFSPAKEFEEGYTLIGGKLPSIADLEKMLNSEEEHPITANPDGSIS